MATSIPTHNLGEVLEACEALIDNPDLTLQDLMKIVPGPDFPTGGIIIGRYGILEAYRTGRGTITFEARHPLKIFAMIVKQSLLLKSPFR